MTAPQGSAPPPVVEVSHLGVRRGDTWILRDLSWRALPGEHWVILGANGSGKTSLLAALTGYLTPSAGSIAVLGARYGQSDWRELRKRVGMVSSALRPWMPEDEPAWITVAGGRHGVLDYWGDPPPDERRDALGWLSLVDASALADRPWAHLSQGERQRVLIGRALMARPALLILDEPCAGLDPVARERFLVFLERLAASPGAPSLALVTHHVEEILPAFSHALLLVGGAVAAAGPVSKVLTGAALSHAFGAEIRLHKSRGRYRLSLPEGLGWS